MRDLFLSDTDIHTATASLVTGKPIDQIDGETRTTHGKVPNFLVTYGGEAFRLHIQTGIPEEEAKKVIAAYFKKFPRVKPWKARMIREAKNRAEYKMINGERRMTTAPYVETMLGRRRRLPDLLVNPDVAGPNRESWRYLNGLKTSAERQAINAIVSGSAAEALKQAMIDVTNYIHETDFPMRLVLNVHDEIVAVTPVEYAEEGLNVLTTHMEAVVNYKTGLKPLEDWVPLVATGKMGDRWSK
jgi:DNA polymerase-1